ncbi:hypothetical protein LQV63_15725 [Paenibacillus profundus]|uniref:Uncharacterized protein n=1 Tax=Paenibacillus profundus TaxID=1173085 RepID=A0ABS8YJK4_9BACL|nr:hypothetical protein [Paenibacillus profundus]MCE5170755.1 hypothetical protein [Paenibacillus profundus]
MKEMVNGKTYLFGIPHSSVPDNDKLFTRRAFRVEDRQLVREGTLEDMRVFNQMLNLYRGESAVKWAPSTNRGCGVFGHASL